MGTRKASPPVWVNITGGYVVAVEGHFIPQHFLPNTWFCLSFHPVWAPSRLSPESTLRKHYIL